MGFNSAFKRLNSNKMRDGQVLRTFLFGRIYRSLQRLQPTHHNPSELYTNCYKTIMAVMDLANRGRICEVTVTAIALHVTGCTGINALRLIMCMHIVPWDMRWRSWLRHRATSRKVAGSITDGITGIFQWHNPSGRTMALRSTQPLTEMSTRDFLGSKAAGA